jgi:hypothetical protein
VLAVLTLLLIAGVALFIAGGDGDDGDPGPAGEPGDTTSTTLAAGDLRIDAPTGWQEVPLPSLGFGIAVPPGWEATRTDADTLAALARGSLVNPGFVDSARNAANAGAVFYAAAQDEEERVSDVKVQVLPRPGATSPDELRQLAEGLLAELDVAQPEPAVEVSADTATFTVDVGTAVAYRVTQVLRTGPDRVVSVIITSEDRSAHDELAAAIAATLVLSAS